MNTRLTSLQRRLTAAVALACTLAAVTSPALAEEQMHPHMHRMGPESWHEDRAMPDRAFDMHREPPVIRIVPAHFASPRGSIVETLPREAIIVPHGGVSYSFHNGVWYRPSGGRFIVVAAPIGAFIPVLPPLYTTVWFGGLPYYYADDVYYSWRPSASAYQVVTPPPGAPAPVVNADRLYAYPLNDKARINSLAIVTIATSGRPMKPASIPHRPRPAWVPHNRPTTTAH